VKLKVNTAWNGPKGVMVPGLYAIPEDISKAYAKACAADGAGEIVYPQPITPAPVEVAKPQETFRPAATAKPAAPANKARGWSPGNKRR
jgi:hypothetical protein